MKEKAISPFAAICSDVGIAEERWVEMVTQKKKNHVFSRASMETGKPACTMWNGTADIRDGGERTEGTGRDKGKLLGTRKGGEQK